MKIPLKQSILVLLFLCALGVDQMALTRLFSSSEPHLFQKSHEYKLDINRAKVAELIVLPSIGPMRAEKIVAYRLKQGGFHSIDDLRTIPGIGEKSLEKIAPLVIFSSPH